MMKKILLSLLLVCSVCFAEDITNIVVPSGPGGGLDISARNFQNYLNEIGVNSIITYKPGAEGLIGLNEINTKQNTLGYVTMASVATYMQQGHELQLISATHRYVSVMVTNPKTSFKTYQDFLHNGQNHSFVYGSMGQKNSIEQLERYNNTEYLKVPFKSPTEAIFSVMSGYGDFAIVPYPLVKEQIKEGKLVILASVSQNKDYPNITRFDKIYKQWIDSSGYCFVIGKNTDELTVNKWKKIIKDYSNMESTRNFYEKEYATSYESDTKILKDLIVNIQKLK